MKFCFFGCFDEQYARNWSMINGLSLFAETKLLQSKKPFLQRSFSLFFKALNTDFDALIVLYPGHLDVFVAKLACFLKRKPLVFDKFVSHADSLIEYGIAKPGSLKARFYGFIDWLNCKVSDLVLLDTQEHVDFFENSLKIKANYAVIPIGTNESEFHYLKTSARTGGKFSVLYYGITTPVHGFDTICEAAERLEKKKVFFTFVGASKFFRQNKEKFAKLSNIKFVQPISKKELNLLISKASVCLGIFGKTPKSERVVPIKVVEALDCRKPLITARGKSLAESLVHKKNVFFCEKTPEGLAQGLLVLKNNPKLRNNIAKNGFKKFKENFSKEAIGKKLFSELKILVEGKN